MLCEMCGSDNRLYKVLIEGTEMAVCDNCTRFGKVLSRVIEPKEMKPIKQVRMDIPEVMEILVENFGKVIRKEREKRGLNQEEFAKKINQKKSIVHKMENSEFSPSIDTAKKLQKLLQVKLVEEYTEQEQTFEKKTESEQVTIGDFIKIKTRKRK